MRSLGRAALLILDDWAQLDAWDRQTLCKITESFLACMAGELDSNQD
jgi:hypothetical protein